MDATTLPTPVLTTSPGGTPRAGRRRPVRPARPRATTTVSAAILTDRGLAEGYVALPLARLMAHRVWASVETLNQQLVLLEQYSFTRMTSDQTFEGQGQGLQQLLGAYATLTEAVATLAQRLAQNRLTEADRQLLTTGHLTALLPAVPPAPTASTDAGPEGWCNPDAPATALPALPPVANGVTTAVL